jgi:SAM-dependent methyltransferase/GNAT superfamily N-acetyltransferase
MSDEAVVEYTWILGSGFPPDELIEECSALYSRHYGCWSARAKERPGEPIRLSASRIRTWLKSKDSRLVLARVGGALVGYAIAIQTKAKDYGMISWVTQLVVHADFRRRDIGKTLLFTIWGFSDHFAWGLVSANPYAVRALEKATRRRCEPGRISRNYRKLLKVGAEHVPYIHEGIETVVAESEARIFTDFFVDHSSLDQMLKDVSGAGTPWNLGLIDEGWEWFAFTFHDQPQLGLSKKEIDAMLAASDQITKKAYAGMELNPESHKWMAHTDDEAKFIVQTCHIEKDCSVLDLGCGTGRHALALARSCSTVCGVDYIENLVLRASERAKEVGVSNASFVHGDCRHLDLRQQFDVVLCLYDVVGTFADDAQNKMILKNVHRHLRPGGRALISVMNMRLTERLATKRFSLSREPSKLLELQADDVMETTGNIFDPRLYMIDSDTGVVYRKEQFTRGSGLPAELLVRDRRYHANEITRMCQEAGLDCEWARHVRAGRWEDDLGADHDRAKEILVLCSRPT